MKTKMLKNQKGFTLIELIVVIAIIAVLAAVLVPSMLGFIKDSRISSANSSAKTVHTAAAAWVTDQNVAGVEVTVNGEAISDGEDQTTGKIGTTEVDLTKALGSDFTGHWYFVVNADGTGVTYALYSKGEIAVADRVQVSKKDQDGKDGQNVIGCYPLLLNS